MDLPRSQHKLSVPRRVSPGVDLFKQFYDTAEKALDAIQVSPALPMAEIRALFEIKLQLGPNVEATEYVDEIRKAVKRQWGEEEERRVEGMLNATEYKEYYDLSLKRRKELGDRFESASQSLGRADNGDYSSSHQFIQNPLFHSQNLFHSQTSFHSAVSEREAGSRSIPDYVLERQAKEKERVERAVARLPKWTGENGQNYFMWEDSTREELEAAGVRPLMMYVALRLLVPDEFRPQLRAFQPTNESEDYWKLLREQYGTATQRIMLMDMIRKPVPLLNETVANYVVRVKRMAECKAKLDNQPVNVNDLKYCLADGLKNTPLAETAAGAVKDLKADLDEFLNRLEVKSAGLGQDGKIHAAKRCNAIKGAETPRVGRSQFQNPSGNSTRNGALHPLHCFRCLGKDHIAANCTNKLDMTGRCARCGRRSHTSGSCGPIRPCPQCQGDHWQAVCPKLDKWIHANQMLPDTKKHNGKHPLGVP